MDTEQELEAVDDSVRSELVRAFEEHEAKEVPLPDSAPDNISAPSPAPSPEPIAERTRDASGKFQKKPKEAAVEKASDPAKQVAVPSSAPKSWKADDKALWDKIPQEARAIIERRESEVERGFTHMDEERTFGKTMKEVVAPYMATIQAEGGTPATAIQSLLNTAYYLRSNASPQEKGRMIIGLAKQFNADITQTTPNSTVQPNNELFETKQKLAQIEQEIRQQPERLRQQQEETLINQHIAAFAADPKNIHFEKLKLICASLLQSGAASSLQDAYEKACRADPEIFSMQEAERQKEAEAKRIADIKAKADKSRKTAVSVRGFPGLPAKINGTGAGSVREDLYAAWDEHVA